MSQKKIPPAPNDSIPIGVTEKVLNPFLALARSEAERVGDTDAADGIGNVQQKIAIAFHLAQLKVWEKTLRAAGAFSRTRERLFDDTKRRLILPSATDQMRGADLVAEVRSLKSQVAEMAKMIQAQGTTRVEIANMEADQADAALEAALRSADANEMTADQTE